MYFAKISSKGQITLPRKIRQSLNAKPGDRVMFVVGDKTVALRPIASISAKTLAGVFRHYAVRDRERGPERQPVKKGVARAAAKEG
jgi:AbrB family looped-hinge helix DNA binding protein